MLIFLFDYRCHCYQDEETNDLSKNQFDFKQHFIWIFLKIFIVIVVIVVIFEKNFQIFFMKKFDVLDVVWLDFGICFRILYMLIWCGMQKNKKTT